MIRLFQVLTPRGKRVVSVNPPAGVAVSVVEGEDIREIPPEFVPQWLTMAEKVGEPLGPYLLSRLHLRCPNPYFRMYGCDPTKRSLLQAMAEPCGFRLCVGHMDRPAPEKQINWLCWWGRPGGRLEEDQD